MANIKRVQEVVEFAIENGDAAACDTHGITQESLARYRRQYKDDIGDLEMKGDLQKIKERYTQKELKAIAEGGRIMPGYDKVPMINFDGDHIKFGLIGDTHIGSKFFKDQYLVSALEECDKQGVEFICHTGDLTEGMSNRLGHVYELSEIGYDAQKERAVDLVSQWMKPIYLIDGNHDRWFLKSNGALIVKDVCELVPNAEYLGQDEGDIVLNGGVTLKLWHGEDASSYAVSYRVQKIVESFTGGEKPNILLLGHVHKMGYFMLRNIHCISGGAIQTQSSWMRSKRMAAHTGFWIIDVWVSGKSVSRLSPTWYPFYA